MSTSDNHDESGRVDDYKKAAEEGFAKKVEKESAFLEALGKGIEDLTDPSLLEIAEHFERGMFNCSWLLGLPNGLHRYAVMQTEVSSRMLQYRHEQEAKGESANDDAAKAIFLEVMHAFYDDNKSPSERNMYLFTRMREMLEDERVALAINSLNGAVIRDAWMCFELLAKRVWIAIVNFAPEKIGGFVHDSLLSEEKGLGWADLAKYQLDLSESIGEVLASRLSFQSLKSIRSAYKRLIPGADWSPILGCPDLNVIEKMRHQLTHNEGRVTEEFLNSLGDKMELFKKTQPGRRLLITDESAHNAAHLIFWHGGNLLHSGQDIADRIRQTTQPTEVPTENA